MEERAFVDGHGVEVHSRFWPVGDARGLVLIAHGASEHSGRYGRFAEALNEAGFAAAAIDHRGHGLSAASTGKGIMGPGGGAAVVDDLHQMRLAAEKSVGAGVPVFLFGHSLGSVIATAYLASHSAGLAGAVLCGVPVDPEGAAAMAEMLAGVAAAGMRDESAGALLAEYNKPFEPGRTAFEWLSRDPAEVDRYIDDPMCGEGNPITFGYLIDLLDVAGPAFGALSAVSCPCLVIAGDQDPAAANGANAEALAGLLGAAGVPVEVKLYGGARHELLNETNRDEVTADLVAWFADRL